MDEKTTGKWRVHTPSSIKEIAECNGIGIFVQPLNIFINLLGQVASRAAELNDVQAYAVRNFRSAQ